MAGRKHFVLIGATSAMAEHCARLWVREPARMTLVGRNAERLEMIAADLRVRSPLSDIAVRTADFLNPADISSLAEALGAAGMDVVLIAHGNLPEQSACESSLQACREALAVNGVSVALFTEAFAGQLQRQGKGTLAVIGSVAGDRGRKSNYVYGAAKGLVERYVQGLQHRLARSGVKVCLIKPGPTATPMTAHLLGSKMKLADVELVAERIVLGVARGESVIYVPGKWRLIMMVIRHLPAAIFNKMDI